tara:strand:- start:1210 stop:1707 length:498 start_codon:yes stop_codon:yes gene_type:complete
MKSLLRTILDECEKNKLMYRANAYDLADNGCEDMIVPWGYDFKALVETMSEFELDEKRGNIQIIPESKVKTHAELIDSIRSDLLEYIYEDEERSLIQNLTDEQIIDEQPDEYYSGCYCIMWTNYGGNEHLDCFTDYTTGLDKYFDVSKLTNDWEDEYNKFRLGLI